MKNLMIVMLAVAGFFGANYAFSADPTLPKIYKAFGGDQMVVQSGGVITMESGSVLNAAITPSFSGMSVSGTSSLHKVVVSSSATSGSSMCFAGSFAALPTTGYDEGCIAYLTSGHTFYKSTETVTKAQSWSAF